MFKKKIEATEETVDVLGQFKQAKKNDDALKDICDNEAYSLIKNEDNTFSLITIKFSLEAQVALIEKVEKLDKNYPIAIDKVTRKVHDELFFNKNNKGLK